jgi:hypothetical protein
VLGNVSVADELNLDFAHPAMTAAGGSFPAREACGNLALVAFVASFDENKNHVRDEHP